MTDDITLLREYARCNSEEAFAALVSRHVNLVYSVALRDVQDPYLAEEITQAVFIILARKAESFDSKVVLSGWLCRTVRYTSANALTVQRRRQQREREAYMQSILNEPEPDAWKQIAPVLSGAMSQLAQKDHDAVVLRFFEGKSFQEIGTALGASENAAKKRVAYALEKLRKFFLKHGIASTTATIAVALSTNSVEAAPTALAKTATAVAIAKGTVASGSTLVLVKGALKIMAWTKAQTAIAISVVAILAASTVTTLEVHRQYSRTLSEFPRSSWAAAGYADPVSAFKTSLWAAVQGDGKTLLASCSPRMQGDTTAKVGRQMAAQGKSLSPEELFTDVGHRFVDGVTGFRILDDKTVSSGQVVLRVYLEGRGEEQTITLKKIGDEWKMDDVQ
ncbi:MAG TPA: sigma-70 family RNA polymerase sigma factor [Verrucomicrobiae bacterium]|nr:sigma-70 family RNA polymerase sigma factor [Verrucomicrobiae bacterium]